MLENSSDTINLIMGLCLPIGLIVIIFLTILFSNGQFTLSRLMFFGAQIILIALFIFYSFFVMSELETLYPNIQELTAENIPVYIGLLITIGIFFFSYAVTACSVYRTQDTGMSKWLTLVMFIPGVGQFYILFLLFWPSQSYA